MKDLKSLSKYIKERNIKNGMSGGAVKTGGDGDDKDIELGKEKEKEKEKVKGKAGACPLHRDDALYSAKNAQEQVTSTSTYLSFLSLNKSFHLFDFSDFRIMFELFIFNYL